MEAKPPEERRYPALRAIAVIYKVLAVLAFLVGLAIGIFGAVEGRVFEGVAAVAIGIIYALFLWAGAELILVVLDIETNTRRTAELLSQRPEEQRGEE